MQEEFEGGGEFNVPYDDPAWDFLQQPLVDTSLPPGPLLILPAKIEAHSSLSYAQEQERGSKRRRGAEGIGGGIGGGERVMGWYPYQNYPVMPLYNANHIDITTALSLQLAVGKNTTFSPEDSCWIHYKNNHFRLDIGLNCPHEFYLPPLFIFDGQSLLPVDSLCTDIYVICTPRELVSYVGNEDMVSIFEADSTRTKNNHKVPDPYPISPNTPVNYNRLRFESATANTERRKGKRSPGTDQEFYRVVAQLKAHVTSTNSYHAVLAYVSDPLIVRGQNPSRYGKYKPNAQTETPAPQPPPVFTDTSSDVSDTLSPNQPYLSPPLPPPSQSYPSPSLPPSSSYSSPSLPPSSSYSSPSQPHTSPSYPSPSHTLSSPSYPSPTPSIPSPPQGWNSNAQAGTTSFYGNVGINTGDPHEALTVGGNVFVTGTITQPSDIRLKKNVTKVDTKDMLKNINNVQIVDYEWKDEWREHAGVKRLGERGVIAQQLQEVLPAAVQPVGDVSYDGFHVDDLLTIDDKALLIENIGATQELSTLYSRFDKRMSRLERLGPIKKLLLALALVLVVVTLVLAGYFLFRKVPARVLPEFPHPGLWGAGDRVMIDIRQMGTGYQVNATSADLWFIGTITHIDVKKSPHRFSVDVISSNSKTNQYLFIYKLDECPQFMHLAFHSSRLGYPSNFATGYLLEKSFPTDINGLPLLHLVNEHVFCKQLSCGGTPTYSSMYLSTFSRKNSIPDLTYDGECGSSFLNISNTCADFSLIGDMGNTDIRDLYANKAMWNVNYYSSLYLRVNHSYYVFSTKESVRYMLVFYVTNIDPDIQHMSIKWAALQYSVQTAYTTSPGFSCNGYNESIAT